MKADRSRRRNGVKANPSMELERGVQAVLGRYFKKPASSIDLDASLVDELGVDSLGILDISFEIQKTYRLTIPDEAFAGIHTGRDMVKALSEGLAN